MGRRHVSRLTAVAVSVAVLSGCTLITNGTVTGVVRGYGGFDSSHDGRLMPNQDIVIEDEHGTRTTVTSDGDGIYSVPLAPGNYTLRCGTGHAVTIEARQTVTLDCDYQMV